jgi:hypothetical protein
MMSDGNICLIYSSDHTRKKITQTVKELIFSYPLKSQVPHTSGNFVSRSAIMFGFIKLHLVFHLCKFYYWSKARIALGMSESSSNNPIAAVFIVNDMYKLLYTQYVQLKRL